MSTDIIIYKQDLLNNVSKIQCWNSQLYTSATPHTSLCLSFIFVSFTWVLQDYCYSLRINTILFHSFLFTLACNSESENDIRNLSHSVIQEATIISIFLFYKHHYFCSCYSAKLLLNFIILKKKRITLKYSRLFIILFLLSKVLVFKQSS